MNKNIFRPLSAKAATAYRQYRHEQTALHTVGSLHWVQPSAARAAALENFDGLRPRTLAARRESRAGHAKAFTGHAKAFKRHRAGATESMDAPYPARKASGERDEATGDANARAAFRLRSANFVEKLKSFGPSAPFREAVNARAESGIPSRRAEPRSPCYHLTPARSRRGFLSCPHATIILRAAKPRFTKNYLEGV